MANILIVYGTTEGQTRKIAQHIGGLIRTMGHNAEVVDSSDVREEFRADGFNAFIVTGSLHQGNHQRSLIHFVKKHRDELKKAPSLFLSVSMSAARNDGNHFDELQKCVDRFTEETEWIPTEWHPVAGALKYVEYDWLKRMIMRSISKAEGGETDTSKDYEYTDWDALDELVAGFLKKSFIFDSTHAQQ